MTMEHVGKFGSWGELYVMLGTSSAALIGLLFVATSLHLDEIVSNRVYRIRALYNSIYLMMTLVHAALVLTPQPMVWLGVEIAALNCFVMLFSINSYKVIYKNRGDARRGGFSNYRAATIVIAFLIGIGGGVGLATQSNWGLYLETISYVTFLVSVVLNAWSIMLGVGEAENATKTGNATARKPRG